jgi:very-short-patch-repair endonuclease
MSGQGEPRGCLIAVFELLGLVPREGKVDVAHVEVLPYQRKDFLLSKAERSFFGVLEKAVADKFLIFAKVRLADLIFIQSGTDKRQSHFNKIQSKHIDFVLCSRDVVRPLLAIELDDSSHQATERRERDSVVDAALGAAGLPILHVPTRSSYNVQELSTAIQSKICA